MGLDLIEFTVAVEDAFGLYIPDAEAATLRTPGVLVDYLLGRTAAGRIAGCLEQRAFYRLRRAGMHVLHHPREAFHPSTPWADLLHPKHHERQWTLLGQAVAVDPWPRLKPGLTWGPTAATVGETARTLATTAPRALMLPGEGWSRPAIEAVIRRLMAEELAVTTFEWSNEFVKDLGCG